MKKYSLNLFKSGYVIFVAAIAIVFLLTWFYMLYTSPIDFQYKYNGVKYQVSNLKGAELINIEVNGKYVKGLFGKYVDFDGTIKVGDKIFTGPLRFNKYKMSSLELGNEFYGMIFISNMLEKITIEIHEPNQSDDYSWSAENGWMISAPCDDRKEAVEISNTLMQRLRKSPVIE